MYVIGLDIGGANIKLATSDGEACSQEFALWKYPERLPGALDTLLHKFDPPSAIAVTMTGELADCFETKAAGVDFILRAAEVAAGNLPLRVWTTTGRFVTPEEARQQTLATAAANWHALATWAARFVTRGNSLLLDIGSTTTDIIPLRDGVPIPQGRTDPERFLSGELIYTGAWRTPLCAVARRVPFRKGSAPVAAELFATMLDVYLLLGQIPENADDRNTADGRPATVAAAHNRLAHMLCCDRTELSLAEARTIAESFANAQQGTLATALEKSLAVLNDACESVIISGSGSFLAEGLLGQCRATSNTARITLADKFTPALAEAACAYAVACLAVEL